MPNYQLAKIYKITGNGLTYYGSTCQPLCKRLAKHKAHKKQYEQGKKNKYSSFEILNAIDCNICLVELYPCNSREELLMRERFYIENNDCVNKLCPIRTQEELKQKKKEEKKLYYERHPEKKREKSKKYYEKNLDKIKEYQKEYREKQSLYISNPDESTVYTTINPDNLNLQQYLKHLKYLENNMKQ